MYAYNTTYFVFFLFFLWNRLITHFLLLKQKPHYYHTYLISCWNRTQLWEWTWPRHRQLFPI